MYDPYLFFIPPISRYIIPHFSFGHSHTPSPNPNPSEDRDNSLAGILLFSLQFYANFIFFPYIKHV